MIDVASEVIVVETELRDRGSPERAVGAKAYLKSDLDFLGVDAGGIRATARGVLGRHPDLDRGGVTALVRALWVVPVFDLRAVGVALLERRPDLLGPEHLELVEELLRSSHTWALVDWIATKVAAPIVAGSSTTRDTLERWSRDPDFWMRRASMLALLPELRVGRGDFRLFESFASRMVGEREFFIRKAIGWVLRDTSKKRPDLAYRFLVRHLDRVSGLTLREGAKYLSREQRDELMPTRRNARG